MKFLQLLLLGILLSSAGNHLFAQCNEWETLLGYKEVFIRDVARDRFGNLYATGSFISNSFQIGGTPVPLYGQMPMFIVKFRKDMSLDWVKSIGSVSGEFPASLEVDKDDNIVIAGYFTSPTITFDCIQLNNFIRAEMFVVKYSPDGHALWAIGSTGLSDGWNMDVAISPTNDIILSTTFLSGGTTLGGHSVAGFGGFDSFVASISPNGSVNWIRDFGGANDFNYDYILGLAVDSQENIAITGFFGSSSVAFDEFIVQGFTISENYFIAKLDKSGKVMWAKGGGAPVDQGGFDVVMDLNDNVVVGGRFYEGETVFENITLTNQGDDYTTDVFVVKYDPDGNVINARSFGGSLFDSPTKMTLDKNGDVLIGGYYYSNTFQIDNFTALKPEFKADAFIATLDDDLKASCFKRVSGSAENTIDQIYTDDANNTWVIVDNIFIDGVTEFDNVFSVNSQDFTSMLVSIGGNDSFLPQTITELTFDIDLGEDIAKCKDEVSVLDAGLLCLAAYTWSDGSHDRYLTTSDEGEYWVEVTLDGKVARDTISIANIPEVVSALGSDLIVCPGTTLTLTAQSEDTQTPQPTYLWQDGSTLPVRHVQTPGSYSVKITGACNTVDDTITISWIPDLTLDLGEDKTFCSAEPFILSSGLNGPLTYEWQDGSTLSEMTVNSSGVYWLSVSNECETVTDSIEIVVLNPDEMIIPNVITPNGDQKNETLILPDPLVGSTVRIFNRWGSEVFGSTNYQNTWTGHDGTYFFTISGPCLNFYKGYVQVLR